ncbi:MAG: hypothetical protein EAZ16_10705 [Sphingobacteriales bacterium]|nr:MAG: hypothetical protein EAZ16_10705 [Sphingobacteriales bacterium]
MKYDEVHKQTIKPKVDIDFEQQLDHTKGRRKSNNRILKNNLNRMISSDIKKKVFVIWDNYAKNDRRVIDKKGSYFEDIDKSRLLAIEDIKKIIHQFSRGIFNIYEFKTNLDSYNKKHNYWGFTAAKGQMFFNLLTKASEHDIAKFSTLIKQVIQEPSNLGEAIEKIALLSNYVKSKQTKIIDKRKGPNPKSAAYFLSYFWQIYNYEKWPVMYSSIIISLTELGLWQDFETAQENYKSFFSLNDDIKEILSTYTGLKITNWEIEHALWNFSGTQSINSKQPKKKENNKAAIIKVVKVADASFDLNDYICSINITI